VISGLKTYIHTLTHMSKKLFSDSRNLRGQSFSYGLGKFNPTEVDSDEFVETPSLSVFVDEEGVTNISEKILLDNAEVDCIDSTTTPQFSKGNKFIAGLAKALPGVPEEGVIAFAGRKVPEGWGRCNGGIYKRPNGGTWTAPFFPVGFGSQDVVWIVRLPDGVVDTGEKRRVFIDITN
jgi:hypothetical protein